MAAYSLARSKCFFVGRLSELTWQRSGAWRVDDLMPNLSSHLDLGVSRCHGPTGSAVAIYEYPCLGSVGWVTVPVVASFGKRNNKSFKRPRVIRALNFIDDDIPQKSPTKLVFQALRTTTVLKHRPAQFTRILLLLRNQRPNRDMM